MNRKVRWGIIGTASIARRRFMPALLKSDKSEAVAIGSRDPGKAQVFASEFNIAEHYGSYQEVLNDPNVEAVYIPLPNQMHSEWTIKAANAGKHILCEKPMALCAGQAQEMADHCASKGVLLMEAFMYRLNPRTLKVKEVIENGMLGEVRTMIAQFGFTINPQDYTRLNNTPGAGALMDTGCYCINISRYLFGEEPVAVIAQQRKHEEFDCDISTSAILEFSGGRTSLISSSFETGFRSAIDVAGSEAVLRVNRFFTPQNEGVIGFTVETRNMQTHLFETDAVDQFLVETDCFADCIREGREIPLDPHKDAVSNARVIDAIRHSAESRCRVEVEKS